MNLIDLVKQSRSYRRFDEAYTIEPETLYSLAETARFVPTTVNSQAIRFIFVTDKKLNEKVFGCLAWAGLLKGKGTPKPGERPSAYIVMLCDKTIGENKHFDDGIIAQTIMLAAAEKGLGGCILGSVDRKELSSLLSIDTDRYSIDLVLALGKPTENVILVDAEKEDSTAYYRDENGNHYVPKKKTDELVIETF